MHDVSAGTPYLSTSTDDIAHVLDMEVVECADWFEDSPYIWGGGKGTDSTMVELGATPVV